MGRATQPPPGAIEKSLQEEGDRGIIKHSDGGVDLDGDGKVSKEEWVAAHGNAEHWHDDMS